MKRLLARLELIEATGVLGVNVDWVNGNYQRILFHSGSRLPALGASSPSDAVRRSVVAARRAPRAARRPASSTVSGRR